MAASRAENGDAVRNAIVANVLLMARRVRAAEPLLAKRVAAGTIDVMGAFYDMDSGRVTLVR